MMDVNKSFQSLLIKKGFNANKVFNTFQTELRLKGVANPSQVLINVVNCLIFPLYTKNRRRGRNIIAIPFPIAYDQQISLVLRQLLKQAKKNKGPLGKCLANCVIEVLSNNGPLIEEHTKLINTLKNNRPFTFIRWLLLALFKKNEYTEPTYS